MKYLEKFKLNEDQAAGERDAETPYMDILMVMTESEKEDIDFFIGLCNRFEVSYKEAIDRSFQDDAEDGGILRSTIEIGSLIYTIFKVAYDDVVRNLDSDEDEHEVEIFEAIDFTYDGPLNSEMIITFPDGTQVEITTKQQLKNVFNQYRTIWETDRDDFDPEEDEPITDEAE